MGGYEMRGETPAEKGGVRYPSPSSELPWDHVHLQRDPETGDYAEMEFCAPGECKRGEDPSEGDFLDYGPEPIGGEDEEEEIEEGEGGELPDWVADLFAATDESVIVVPMKEE